MKNKGCGCIVAVDIEKTSKPKKKMVAKFKNKKVKQLKLLISVRKDIVIIQFIKIKKDAVDIEKDTPKM